LVSPNYKKSVDIWRIGCIVAELAFIWDDPDNDPLERFLFKGTSCHPLSPMESKSKSNKAAISQNDQLIKIL
jgi:hypothetical protein